MTNEVEGYFADLGKFSAGRQILPEHFMTPDEHSTFHLRQQRRKQAIELNRFEIRVTRLPINNFATAVGGFFEPAPPTQQLNTLLDLPFTSRVGRLSWFVPDWSGNAAALEGGDIAIAQLDVNSQLFEGSRHGIYLEGQSQGHDTKVRQLGWKYDHYANEDVPGSWTMTLRKPFRLGAGDQEPKVTLIAQLDNPSTLEFARMLRFYYTELI